jgi:hypothetical protein
VVYNITSDNKPQTINNLTPDEQREISKLKAIDTKVKNHELAHEAAGGALAGAPSYSYVKGPDGKNYAVAGEVPIKIQKGKTPKETIKLMQQVKAAALAPSDPSPQDLRVAQIADMIAAKAQQQLNSKSTNTTQRIDFYA